MSERQRRKGAFTHTRISRAMPRIAQLVFSVLVSCFYLNTFGILLFISLPILQTPVIKITFNWDI